MTDSGLVVANTSAYPWRVLRVKLVKNFFPKKVSMHWKKRFLANLSLELLQNKTDICINLTN
jgi:hypothetical protein